MAERSASADPFVHAENTWNTFNSASYSLMVKSIRDVLLLLVDKKQNHAIYVAQSDQMDSSTHSNVTANVSPIETTPNLAANNNSPNQNLQEADPTTTDNNKSMTASRNNEEDSIMAVPLRRETSSRPDNSVWSWSMISKSKNTDDDEDLPMAIQPGLPAQQKKPSWSLTHSYVRDVRVNSAELRMLSAELNMIRDSKITRSLRSRRYRGKREDDFVWGRRSCLRIVRVGEYINNDKQ
ncbi:hypothetical protein BJV82DRAFT_674500 [Fennellomyces sp. T-0311]|nr:hypothetical protein BJV82DRAFT_674500 [Fennellomyces sp. T-0311]